MEFRSLRCDFGTSRCHTLPANSIRSMSKENVYYVALHVIGCFCVFLFYLVFAIDCMFVIEFDFLINYLDGTFRFSDSLFALALNIQRVLF